MTPKPNKRYTPKKSIEALRQKWLTVSPDDARLNQIGRQLALSARDGRDRFAQVCRELEPENDG